MEINKIYRIVISEPFALISPETNRNVFTAQVLDKITDKKDIEHILMKVKIPFVISLLEKDEIVKDESLASGKYKRVKEYKDLKVEYLIGTCRHGKWDYSTLNLSYIPNNLVEKFKDIDAIKNELIPVIIGSPKKINNK